MNTSIHLFLLFAVLLVALLYTLRPTLDRKKRVVRAITVIMTLFSGLRTWWMGDLIKYYTLYRNCNGPNWKATLTEKWSNMGIRLLFKLSGTLGISYEACIFLIAAFAAISLGIIIYRYSTSPFISYLMYIGMGFYIFTFSGLKQTIAMGFICFAMISILEERPKRFLLWTLIGGFFHAPALIFLLAYPFANKKVDRGYILFLITAFAIVFVFRNSIVSMLSTLYQDDADAYGTASKLIGGRFIVMLLILAGGYYLRPLNSSDKTYSKTFNVMVLAALFQTFSVYNNVFTRLTDYFYQFIILFLPMVLRPFGVLTNEKAQLESPGYFRTKEVYTIAVVAITAYAVYYYMGYLNSSSGYLASFRFFWQLNAHALYGG